MVEVNEVVEGELGALEMKGPFLGSGGVFFCAPFFLGKEAFVEILEDGEFAGEFADGNVAAECIIDARFDKGEDGAAESARVRLTGELDGAGALGKELGGAGLLVLAGAKSDEGTVAGFELQTFGTRSGDVFESLVVGVLLAKLEDSLLVLRRKVGEFGTRFSGFSLGVEWDVHGCFLSRLIVFALSFRAYGDTRRGRLVNPQSGRFVTCAQTRHTTRTSALHGY